MKKTAKAYANLALIKYWGKADEKLNLPANSSFSVNLSKLFTVTTVSFSREFTKDIIEIKGIRNEAAIEKISGFLDRVRTMASSKLKAKVSSLNSFPIASGLSSSSSAFASTALAAVSALRLNLSEKELSVLARKGSGSAARSIPGGFVQWDKALQDEASFAFTVFPPDYFDLVDMVVIIADREKEISSREAQKSAFSSPFFQERLKRIPAKMKKMKSFIKERDFPHFGELVEEEALELHTIMMTSRPSYIYWYPETLRLMRLIKIWRKEGLPVYFSLNTGHNLHLLTQSNQNERLKSKLKTEGIKDIIVNYPAGKAHLVNDHLF